MAIEITSPSNKNIKHIKSLHKRKYRERHNEFLVEGLRIVDHAMDNNARFDSIYYCDEITNTDRGSELLKRITNENIDLYKVSDKIFKEISTTDNSQGIIGIVKREYYNIEDIIKKDKFFLLVLDRLQDPGNVGTIIRTADSAGVDGIIVLKGTVDIYNSKTIRSTMGSIFSIPIFHVDDIINIVNILKKHGSDIISTTLKAEKYHFQMDYGNKNAIIIGNEANGISDVLMEQSNIKVKIPILGNAESLNASIASGIIIYELVRQNYVQKIE